MSFTDRELIQQLRSGYLCRDGFRMLWDAECYGNVSSLGALRTWLAELEATLRAGKHVEVEGDRRLSSEQDLLAWIEEKFPDTYACFFKERRA